MQQRISRPEVELVHGLVYKAVSELLKVEGQADADRLHCRVTGSYIRGKPMTGAGQSLPACFQCGEAIPTVAAVTLCAHALYGLLTEDAL